MGIGMMSLLLSATAMVATGGEGQAPPVMLPLEPSTALTGAVTPPPVADGYVCVVAYGDCMRIVTPEAGQAALVAYGADPSEAVATAPMPLADVLASDEDGGQLSLWNQAIRLAPQPQEPESVRTYLVGFVRARHEDYSGGYAESMRLHLFRLVIGSDNSAALGDELLNLPWSSQAEIRACFTEQDLRDRREACHDIYRSVPTLAVAGPPAATNGLPDLLFAIEATAYPRTSRRDRDNSAGPPLTAEDLSEWRDPDCSYSRRLAYNPATLRYEMDRPAPDCPTLAGG